MDQLLSALEETSEINIDPATLAEKKAIVLQRLQAQIAAPMVPVYIRGWFRVAAAAILLIGIAGTLWMVNRPTEQIPAVAIRTNLQEVAPGHNGAGM